MGRRVEKIDGLGLRTGAGTGENVVKTYIYNHFNFTDTPEMAVYSWKESPGHDENQMGPRYNAAGMGVYCKPFVRKYSW